MAKTKAEVTEKKYKLKLVPKTGIETIPKIKLSIPESLSSDMEIDTAEIDGILFFFVPDGLMQGAPGDDFARFAQDVREETGKKVYIVPNFFDIAKCEIVKE